MPWLRTHDRPRIEAETVRVSLPGGAEIELLRVRDPRARRLRLSVGERGARLTLPRAATLRQAEAFVREHARWLVEQLERQAAPAEGQAGFGRGHAGPLPLRGRRLALAWREGRYARVALEPEGIVATAPQQADDAALRAALREFYLAQARADLGAWLPRHLPSLPAAPRRLLIRPLSSLWGSLSGADTLTLDLALVLGPPAAFEYVLVHELCHLLHRNHSPAFWREVERRFPAWRAQRDFFRSEGMALKAALRRLIAAR